MPALDVPKSLLEKYDALERLERRMVALVDETQQCVKKNVRTIRYFVPALLAIGLLLAGLVMLAVWNNSHLSQRMSMLQEQIDFLNKKDNFLEKNLNLAKQYAQDAALKAENKISVEERPSAFEETPSPFDHILQNQIEVQPDQFVIRNSGMRWSQFTDSGSMEPLITATADGIEVSPKSVTDIHVGDIISYEYANATIIHRVIRLGEDPQGWYAIAKGDTLEREDPSKIRFGQIRGILVGIIY